MTVGARHFSRFLRRFFLRLLRYKSNAAVVPTRLTAFELPPHQEFSDNSSEVGLGSVNDLGWASGIATLVISAKTRLVVPARLQAFELPPHQKLRTILAEVGLESVNVLRSASGIATLVLSAKTRLVVPARLTAIELPPHQKLRTILAEVGLESVNVLRSASGIATLVLSAKNRKLNTRKRHRINSTLVIGSRYSKAAVVIMQ
jgi:hypothetical protein